VSSGVSQNVAIGTQALYDCTANNNVAVGYNAAYEMQSGTETVSIGNFAHANATSGNSNTMVGYAAGDALSNGAQNHLIGSSAGGTLTTGSNNIMVGYHAGQHNVNTTTGANNILIGSYSDTTAADSTYCIVLGYDVTCAGASNFTFGNGSTDTTCVHGATTWTAPSDVRLKEDIKDEEIGLEFVNELRPVTFQWKKAKDVPSEMKAHNPDSEERVMNGKHNHGFIAQEVKEVIDRYDFKEGFDMWTEDGEDGRQRIGESALIPILVKAIQELSTDVEKLKGA